NAGVTDWTYGLGDPVIDRITRTMLDRLGSSAPQVVPEELEDQLEALDAVRRAPRPSELVTLRRAPHERDVSSERPQHREQLFPLVDRTPEIVLGVQDEQRCRDLGGVRERRERAVDLRGLPRIRADVPLEEATDVARAILGRDVVDGALGDRAPEPVGVP